MNTSRANHAPPEGSEELTRQVVAACRSLGFVLAGATRALESSRSSALREWLAAGKHGEMSWMADEPDVRADPRRLLSGATSIIMVADRYAMKHTGVASGVDGERNTSPSDGRIARYAHGLDYHAVMKRRLHTLADALRGRYRGHEFRAFVDTAPVLEREHAARAGLGFIGKHTLLINPEIGSYLLLGGILTTLELAPSPEAGASWWAGDHTSAHDGATSVLSERWPAGGMDTNRCGSCTRCIDACPTAAITPYSVDATRCISYLTIEHRSEIAEPLRRSVGDWIAGCDVCQEVCPFNQLKSGRSSTGETPAHPAYAPRRASLNLADVMGWTEEDRTRELSGSALKRITLDMMKRNAAAVIEGRKDAAPGDSREQGDAEGR